MAFSSSKTGSTDFRDTDVQQPNVAATPLTEISSRAFSAKSGQSEAGSTTTASSFFPSRPPFLFCSSIRNSIVSFSVVSEIAIVPDSEWRTPTLIVSSCAPAVPASKSAPAIPPSPAEIPSNLFLMMTLPLALCIARRRATIVPDFSMPGCSCSTARFAVKSPKASPAA
jgi:hypothetical protein